MPVKELPPDLLTDERLRLFDIWSRNSWAFLTGKDVDSRPVIWTRDELDRREPVKPFPDFRYLRVLVELLDDERLVALEKSRQLVVTTTVTLHSAWDCGFHRARRVVLSKQTRDLAAAIVRDKLRFPWTQMPAWLRSKLLISLKPAREVRFPLTESYFVGAPQNVAETEARGGTSSRTIIDEAAWQDRLEDIIDGAMPQAGQLVLLSSARRSCRAAKVFLSYLERKGTSARTFRRAKVENVGGIKDRPTRLLGVLSSTGVDVWRSHRGFACLRLHYSANPAKRRKTWLEVAMPAYSPTGWRREMEIDWEAAEGDAFYAQFAEAPHLYLRPDFPDLIEGPVYCGWDFGMSHPAVVFLQYSRESQTVYVIREMIGEVPNFEVHSFRDCVRYLRGQVPLEALTDRPQAIRQLAIMKRKGYPDPPWFGEGVEFVDLSGPEANKRWPKSPGFVTTDAEVLWEGGVQLQTFMTYQRDRTRLMRKLLTVRANGKPGFFVSERGCPELVKGLKGGIIFKTATAAAPDPYEPEIGRAHV